jgi:polysaccharide export outer membrane protein
MERVQRPGVLAIALAAAVVLAPSGSAAQASAPQNAGKLPGAFVRAGDRLVLHLLGGEQLMADTLTVSSSGIVALPKLGSVQVTDFTIASLPDTLRARYAKFYRNPSLDIVVLRRVVVNGEVKRPDVYFVDANTTLPDAIAIAGGLTEAASRKGVTIRRDGESIRVENWETSGATVADLRSGDQIIVGRKSWWSMNILPAVSTLAVVASILITLRR